MKLLAFLKSRLISSYRASPAGSRSVPPGGVLDSLLSLLLEGSLLSCLFLPFRWVRLTKAGRSSFLSDSLRDSCEFLVSSMWRRSAICSVYSLNSTFCRYSSLCWAWTRSFLHFSQASVSSSWKRFICWMKTSLLRSRYQRIRFFYFSRLRSNSSRISYSCLEQPSPADLPSYPKDSSQFRRKVIVRYYIPRVWIPTRRKDEDGYANLCCLLMV